MSQQALDLRRSVQIVRQHRRIFAAIVVLGLLLGAAYAVLNPPKFGSSALVVLPAASSAQNEQSQSASADGTGTDTYIATQVVIANSDSVLLGALPHISPSVSLQTLQNDVTVSSLAGSVLSISAAATSAARAEAAANAVASSYITYVSSASSPVGRVPARILESAASATGGNLPEQVAVYGLLGLIGGALVGFVVSLAIGRNERRLRERSAIANSIGAPVLASVPANRPSDPGSWAKLLAEYEPGAVDAWALSKLLRHFGATDADDGNGAGVPALTVLSLASDRGALALGPQLAAFAASRGVPTALVIGPQQDVNGTATLRAACSVPLESPWPRQRTLRLVVADDEHADVPGVRFAVVVLVVDGKAPLLPAVPPTAATVLAVSAGAATAEQLARAAAAAAAGGHEISGILVADPDPGDQTSGRIPRLAPPVRPPLPTRVNDVQTEISR
jgi:capsular polysaccharide biosynthesis protein